MRTHRRVAPCVSRLRWGAAARPSALALSPARTPRPPPHTAARTSRPPRNVTELFGELLQLRPRQSPRPREHPQQRGSPRPADAPPLITTHHTSVAARTDTPTTAITPATRRPTLPIVRTPART